MDTKGHYVSQFHLKQFTAPERTVTPCVWLGTIPDGPIKQKGIKKIGYRRGMFDGPGGLADRDMTLETFLGQEIEHKAAPALREVCGRQPGGGGEIPSGLLRYLAWAAARSLPMQKLEAQWASQFSAIRNAPPVEPPPDGLLTGAGLQRDSQWLHPSLGTRVYPVGTDFERLIDEG